MKSGNYSIPLSGLKDGGHLYDFKIDDKFFDQFEESEIKRAELVARVNLTKRPGHLELKVELRGSVKIRCDRCLGDFDYDVNSLNVLYIKYGDRYEEVDDQVIIIPAGVSQFDLTQFIYEFAHLAIPLKRTHPDDKNGFSGCNREMLDKLANHTAGQPAEQKEEENNDPRWEKLNKLKDSYLN